MKPFVSGRVVMVDGPKYDLDMVLVAHELVVDAVADLYGPAVMCADPSPKRHRTKWPHPGRAVAMELWPQLAAMHEADSTSVNVMMPEVTLQVRLLGMTWVVQDEKSGELKLRDGEPIEKIDPTPLISVLGTWNEQHKKYNLLSGDIVDRIALLMAKDGPLCNLGLHFFRSTESTHATEASGQTDRARIYFPHATYGAGRGIIAARCVSSDGGDPDPSTRVEV